LTVSKTGLAQVSNVTLVLAIMLYAVAMLAYACDLAFGKRRAATATPSGQRRERVDAVALVGAASGAELAGHAFPADPADPSELADRLPEPAAAAEKRPLWPEGPWLAVAFVLTCAGFALQVISVAARGVDEHRVPWGNMYEFIAAITCAAVLMLILAAIRFRAYYLGLFVLLPVVLALAVDVVVIYTPPGQLVPALQSYWITIHVTAMIISIGMFIIGAVATVLFLLSARHERRVAAGQESAAAGIMARLPGAETFDRLSYRAVLFGFPAWTFAVIAGAMWADHAWGRYWGWDPKETWSFIIWLVYAAFLHARATAGWRGRRAAYIQLFGFACLMFNIVAVNLWISGMHSYAGVH